MTVASAEEQKVLLSSTVKADTLLEHVDFFRIDANRKLDAVHRANLGQFFTPTPVASLMASMFSGRPQTMTILDAGAGVGSLSAALVAEACHWEQKPKSIAITAYEIDPLLIDYLQTTFNECSAVCRQAGIEFRSEIFQEDFIAAGVAMVNGGLTPDKRRRFNCVIMNPPYKKMNSESQERRLLRHIDIETSNLYTAFLWLSLKLLDSEGEIVAITPRSFCNGPYFRPFREALFKSMTLRRIHVFDSRKKAFREDDVLQENVIIHAVKSTDGETRKVIISSSVGPDDELMTVREVDYDQLVQPKDPEAIIHIVTDEMAHKIRERMKGLYFSLKDLNLTVSTGRVVDFRAKNLLRNESTEGTVPLIYPAHFSQGFISWPNPGLKKPDAISKTAEKYDLLAPSGFYVLVKRFSSKEEARRIVAAIYDPDRVPANMVGFENHVNYYHRRGEGMPAELAKGLAAFLNSTLVDQYFRQFSGHTQVNATDLRSLMYPSEIKLRALGSKIGNFLPSQDDLDLLVKDGLGIMVEDTGGADPIEAKKRIEEALDILQALNLPRAQQNKRSALTLLALLDMKVDTPWTAASSPLRGITEMMDYFREFFGVTYAPNSRETVRRFTIHQFVQAGLVIANPDNPNRPVNSPDNRYQIEARALELIATYGTDKWKPNLKDYLQIVDPSKKLHPTERYMKHISVKLPNGEEVNLTAGGQNELIKYIIEEFCAQYLPGGTLVYCDDAGPKRKEKALEYLKKELNIELDIHGKMPDVIIHIPEKNWLVLVEAVTSHGPIDIKRHNELKELFGKPGIGLIFVTTFMDRSTMARYLPEIAWETEVWVREAPTHLIHFNGERFLGPYD